MIREQWEFVGFVAFLVLLVVLAFAEAKHVACRPGDGAVTIGQVVKLYGC